MASESDEICEIIPRALRSRAFWFEIHTSDEP